LARAAELLKTGGTIALVWTADRSQGSAFWQATAPIYDTYNPQTSSGNLPLEIQVDLYRQALRTSRQFAGVHEVRKVWTKRYSGDEYLKLLQTFSDHQAMPEPNKSRFFEAIVQVIAQMGGEVIRDYETLALLGRVVFGVLRKVAMGARFRDHLDDGGALDQLQMLDLVLQGLIARGCHRNTFHPLHLDSTELPSSGRPVQTRTDMPERLNTTLEIWSPFPAALRLKTSF
jgi:hypothetical protein